MEIISGTTDFKLDNTAVAIGKFDGLHLGHQALIRTIQEWHGPSVMLTFDFHPGMLLGRNVKSLLYTAQERRIIAERLGVDVLIEYPFTRETAAVPARQFTEQVIAGQLGAGLVAVGTDFRFGAGRSGNAELLTDLGRELGFVTEVIPKVTHILPDGRSEIISSSVIREAVEAGEMEAASQMLGRPFEVMGVVCHGRKIGRTIDMPTANLEPDPEKLLPPNGVYASTVALNGKIWPAVTNVGVNPTVAARQNRRTETYIYGFSGDLYDQELCVALHHFARPEMKFSGIDALKAQMHADMRNSLAWLTEHGLIEQGGTEQGIMEKGVPA